LFACSGAVATVVAVGNAVTLARVVDEARVRELAFFAGLRRLLDETPLNVTAVLPRVVNLPFDLTRPAGLASFVCVAVATSLILTWILALVLVPVAALPPARAATHAQGRADRAIPAGERWTRVYPAVVLLLFASPVVVRHVAASARAGRAGAAVVLGLAAVLAAIGLVTLFLRAPAWARRVERACAAITVAAAVTGFTGLALAMGRTSAAGPPRPVARAGLPNVLLISIDTLRPDHLGCYGYGRDTSPAIDELAREGARFTTVVSPTSWTLPAHLT
jgi:hypothetical protein